MIFLCFLLSYVTNSYIRCTLAPIPTPPFKIQIRSFDSCPGRWGGGGFAYGRVSDHNAPLKSREKVVRRENEGKEGVLPIVGGKESPEDRRVTLLYWH